MYVPLSYALAHDLTSGPGWHTIYPAGERPHVNLHDGNVWMDRVQDSVESYSMILYRHFEDLDGVVMQLEG
jgi:hypothetical protein